MSLTEPLLERKKNAFYEASVVKLVSPVTILAWGVEDMTSYLRFSHTYPIAKLELGDSEIVKTTQMKWRWKLRGTEGGRDIQSPISFESNWRDNGLIDLQQVCTQNPFLQSITNAGVGEDVLGLDPTSRNAFLDHSGMECTYIVFSRLLTDAEKLKVVQTLRAYYYNIVIKWDNGGKSYSSFKYT